MLREENFFLPGWHKRMLIVPELKRFTYFFVLRINAKGRIKKFAKWNERGETGSCNNTFIMNFLAFHSNFWRKILYRKFKHTRDLGLFILELY